MQVDYKIFYIDEADPKRLMTYTKTQAINPEAAIDKVKHLQLEGINITVIHVLQCEPFSISCLCHEHGDEHIHNLHLEEKDETVQVRS